ncbi:PREDICTED: uncharacterized protein LOC105571084 [Vollenhovia emeryi]|uniref:uncharacterized protein LOC105571084 n=1 Tax=Vollenhovia emeryi TaxID=411798 RepID=UPI0005F39D17|nr:PREDICTED: uncharacterized protein LOC105571084 [Vollenhovia emeryi]
MKNNKHQTRCVEDGKMSGTKGTGRVVGKSQEETQGAEASVLAGRSRGTRPGPLSSKMGRDVPLPESDGSDTEHMVEVVEDGDTADSDETTSTSSVDQVTGKRKRRGRPPTTYAGIKKRRRDQCRRELQKLKAEKRALTEVLDPRVEPKSTTPERDIVRRMEVLDGGQIAAEMIESVDVVTKVYERSKNLKGTYVKELKNSAKILRAAATVVATKTAGSGDGAAEAEIRRLKEKVSSLEQLGRITLLLQEEREARARAEGAVHEVEIAETPVIHAPTAQTRSPTKSVEEEKRTRSKTAAAKADKKKRKTVSARVEEALVYRPEVRGERKRMEDPPMETAMEDVRKVFEGVSIKEVVNGGPQETREKLENLVIRCQGALARIPREQEQRSGDQAGGGPRITKVVAVKDRVRIQAKETAAQICAKERAPKKQTPSATPTNSWVEVVKRGGKRKPGARPANTEASSNASRGEEKLRYADVARAKQPSSQPAKAGKASLQIPAGEGGKPEAKRIQKAVEETRVSTAQGAKATKKRRRAPRSEAVSITFPAGEGAQGMREIRAKINLETLGIGPLKQRRGLTGALIFEVSGPESAKKADALANEMRGAVAGKEGVRISRPKKMAEIRIKDVDESITKDELVHNGREAHQGRVGVTKSGSARRPPTGVLPVPREGARAGAMSQPSKSEHHVLQMRRGGPQGTDLHGGGQVSGLQCPGPPCATQGGRSSLSPAD